jgi:hypothetical protein
VGFIFLREKIKRSQKLLHLTNVNMVEYDSIEMALWAWPFRSSLAYASVTRLPHATATVWTNFPSSTSEENLAATHF